MLSCRYPQRHGTDKLPCVFKPPKPALSTELFKNIDVRVYDPDIYTNNITVYSGIECAVIATLLGSIAFIFRVELSACLLRVHVSSYRPAGQVPLSNGMNLMLAKVRDLTQGTHHPFW